MTLQEKAYMTVFYRGKISVASLIVLRYCIRETEKERNVETWDVIKNWEKFF